MMTGGGPGSRFKIQNKYLREFLAEFLGKTKYKKLKLIFIYQLLLQW